MADEKVAIGGKDYTMEEVRVMRLLQNMGAEQEVKSIALRIIGDDAKDGTSKTNPAIKAFYGRLSDMAKRGLIAKGEKRGTYKVGKEGTKVLNQQERELNPEKAKEQDRKSATLASISGHARKQLSKRRARNKAAKKSRKKNRGRK